MSRFGKKFGNEEDDIEKSSIVSTTIEVDPDDNTLYVDAKNNRVGIVTDSPESTLSTGIGRHIVVLDQDIRFAHSGDNTVIVELHGVKITATAIITKVIDSVKTQSNI